MTRRFEGLRLTILVAVQVAVTSRFFDLWQDPQERYDIVMNNFTERTWIAPIMGDFVKS